MIHKIRSIDSHAAGEPLRLVVEGMPGPEGRTMLEKRAWAMKRLDHLRRAIMLEPRGHVDMYGALLTEPVTKNAGDASNAWTLRQLGAVVTYRAVWRSDNR